MSGIFRSDREQNNCYDGLLNYVEAAKGETKRELLEATAELRALNRKIAKLVERAVEEVSFEQ